MVTSRTAPHPLTDENAPLWARDDMRPGRYTITLSPSQVDEVTQALTAAEVQLAGRDMLFDREISAAQFPLPRTRAALVAATSQVAAGRGFAVIRGLPVAGLGERQCQILIRGLTAHLAAIATQSRDGHLIRDVRDTGRGLGDAVTRGHQTTERLYFHTDGADAAVLLCRQTAACGGLSRLACAATVHNRMLQVDPAATAALYEPFAYHMADGNTPGCPPTFSSPIFSLHRGQFSARYVRHTLLETEQVTGVPLSAEAIRAFDLIEEIAGMVSVDMELLPGDLQIVNNHTVLHSRTAYTDDEDHQRHLLRCWLTLPGYTGRREREVDEMLRYGWLTDRFQRKLAAAGDSR